jgi:hypothetical protein
MNSIAPRTSASSTRSSLVSFIMSIDILQPEAWIDVALEGVKIPKERNGGHPRVTPKVFLIPALELGKDYL